MKKVVNVHVYPSNIVYESRMLKTAKTLEQLESIDEIMLCGIQTGDLPLSERYSKKTLIKRMPTSKIWNRKLQYIFYYCWLIILLFKVKPRVLTVHILELLPLAFIAKKFINTKIVYDAHELETEKIGMTPFRQSIAKKIEKLFVKYVDKITVVGYEIADYYKVLYPHLPKPEVILNTPYYQTPIKNDYFRLHYQFESTDLIFLYQGMFSKGRGIETTLKAFEKLKDKAKKVVFLGYGPLEKLIMSYALRCSNIFCHEAVKPAELLNYTSSADWGIFFLDNPCLSYEYALPNKLFEYTMAGLPVIVTPNIQIKKMVDTYKIGKVTKSHVLKDLVLILENTNYQHLQDFQFSVINFRSTFHWQMQEEQILCIYQKCLLKS